MVQSRSARDSYDRVAERYATEIAGELVHKPLDRALLAALAETAAGGVLADIGCGPAHVAAYLHGRGAHVVGIDLSPAMCAIARRDHHVAAAAADMTNLPVRTGTLAAIACLYAVIHLDVAHRAAAYREFARVLEPGGQALIAFHVADADLPTGGTRTLTDWWGHEVELTFRFLDPDEERAALADAGLTLTARLDREPVAGGEHGSRRTYLLVHRA